MSRVRIFWLLAVIPAISLLAGCASKLDSPQPVPPSNLSAYITRTSAISPSVTLPATHIPIPTPTPFIYKIVRNDTLSGIARRFGISLEALLTANPGIAPEALTVGQTLTIPSASQGTDPTLLFTPAPLDLGPGFCRPSGAGTVCLIPVHNPYSQALENVKVRVTLFDENGQSLASQEAILPLNILPPDQVLPAVVFFSGLTVQASAQVQLITSIRLSPGDGRYLQTTIQNLLVSVDWNGLSANVQGQILLPETGKPAASIWLAAVAYDASGQIIGYRRWEWSGSLQPGASQAFALSVYSLGPPIQHVEVLVEARP